MRFEWDPAKAGSDYRKHLIRFEEAPTVFNDPAARELFDYLHSDDEDRYHLLGMSEYDRLLVVTYCYRNDDLARIISARKALPRERLDYLARWMP